MANTPDVGETNDSRKCHGSQHCLSFFPSFFKYWPLGFTWTRSVVSSHTIHNYYLLILSKAICSQFRNVVFIRRQGLGYLLRVFFMGKHACINIFYENITILILLIFGIVLLFYSCFYNLVSAINLIIFSP